MGIRSIVRKAIVGLAAVAVTAVGSMFDVKSDTISQAKINNPDITLEVSNTTPQPIQDVYKVTKPVKLTPIVTPITTPVVVSYLNYNSPKSTTLIPQFNISFGGQAAQTAEVRSFVENGIALNGNLSGA